MKYMLFAWESYYPKGGMNDFLGYFNSTEGAEKEFNKGFLPNYALDVPVSQQSDCIEYYDNGQIVNATSLQVEKEL